VIEKAEMEEKREKDQLEAHRRRKLIRVATRMKIEQKEGRRNEI